MVRPLDEWIQLRSVRVDGKRPMGTVFISDQRREVDFARSRGMNALLMPWLGDLPDFRPLVGLDLIVFLRGRRFDGQAGVKVLQDIVGAEPRSMLAKLGWYGETKWIVQAEEQHAAA